MRADLDYIAFVVEALDFTDSVDEALASADMAFSAHFGFNKDGTFSGPNPPTNNPGWKQVATGPRGGKRWKFVGEEMPQIGGKPQPSPTPNPPPATPTSTTTPPLAPTATRQTTELSKQQKQGIASTMATSNLATVLAKLKSSPLSDDEKKAGADFAQQIDRFYKKRDGFVPRQVTELINSGGGSASPAVPTKNPQADKTQLLAAMSNDQDDASNQRREAYRQEKDRAFASMPPAYQELLRQDILAGVEENVRRTTVGPSNDVLFAQVAKSLPGLTKDQFIGAVQAMHKANEIRGGGWARMIDDIPDKDLVGVVGSKLQYYVQPANPAAFSLENPEAQSVLDEVKKKIASLSRRARRALQRALAKEDRGEMAKAIVEMIAEFRQELADLLGEAQLAALLQGARQVAEVLPVIAVPETLEDVSEDIDEAVKALSSRNVVTREEYDRLDAASRQKAFTVAGLSARETLEKIKAALVENLEEIDLESFRAKVVALVEPGTFLSAPHIETIFRNAVQGALSDGQMAMLAHPVVKEGFPYAAYDAVRDDRVRHNHLSLEKRGLDGTNVYRVTDPVLQMFRPPWDYNCRCGWTPLSVQQAADAGVSEAVKWLREGAEPSPPAFVPWPPFLPPPSFRRDVASVQMSLEPIDIYFGQWQKGQQIGQGKRGEPIYRKRNLRVSEPGAAFGMVGDEWHGPKPPGDPNNWAALPKGPRGGQRWKYKGGNASADKQLLKAERAQAENDLIRGKPISPEILQRHPDIAAKVRESQQGKTSEQPSGGATPGQPLQQTIRPTEADQPGYARNQRAAQLGIDPIVAMGASPADFAKAAAEAQADPPPQYAPHYTLNNDNGDFAGYKEPKPSSENVAKVKELVTPLLSQWQNSVGSVFIPRLRDEVYRKLPGLQGRAFDEALQSFFADRSAELIPISSLGDVSEKTRYKGIGGVGGHLMWIELKKPAAFGMDAQGFWHGPTPPSEGNWTQVRTGSRGGKVWKQQGGTSATSPRGESVHDQPTYQKPPQQKPDIHEQATGNRQSPQKPLPKPSGSSAEEPTAEQQPWAQPTRPATAQSLAQTPRRMSPMKGSANTVFRAEMPDGSQGVYKPEVGEDPTLRNNIEGGTYWLREVASSMFADHMGMRDMVPVTVAVNVGKMPGSMQAWVPNAKTGAQVAGRGGNPFGDDDDAVTRAAIFDFVTGNTDRHAGNWMLDAQGNMHLIDNGLSLPTSDDQQNYFNAHLLRRAVRKGAVVPDVSRQVAAWPKIEKELEGIEPEALQLAKQRLLLLAGARGKPLSEVPSPVKGYRNLGEMLDGVRHRQLPQSRLPVAEFTSAPAEQRSSNEPTKKS